MRVRQYAQGKFYTIECPEGTRVVRRPAQPADGDAPRHDHLVVPLDGGEIRIPAEPPELLPLLAESGNFGVSPGSNSGRARRRSIATVAGTTSSCRSIPTPESRSPDGRVVEGPRRSGHVLHRFGDRPRSGVGTPERSVR
jgi:hypothetical protein